MSIIENLKKIYKSSDASVIVLDENFLLKWKSKDNLPSTIYPEDFTDGNNILQLPLSEETVYRHKSGSAVKITPYIENNNVSEYILYFFDHNEIEKIVYHSNKLNEQINYLGNIRLKLSDILYTIEKIEHTYYNDSIIVSAAENIKYNILCSFSATTNLTEISKFQSGSVTGNYISLNDKLQYTINWAKKSFERLNCKIEYHSEPLIFAYMNYDRLEAVLLNLIINAYMYSKCDEKIINISLYEKDKFIYLNVSDNGTVADISYIEKISYGNEEKLFFKNTESLGLFLARTLAEYFGGTLILEKSPTGGLSVTVSFKKLSSKVPMTLKLPQARLPIMPYDIQNSILAKGVNPFKNSD